MAARKAPRATAAGTSPQAPAQDQLPVPGTVRDSLSGRLGLSQQLHLKQPIKGNTKKPSHPGAESSTEPGSKALCQGVQQGGEQEQEEAQGRRNYLVTAHCCTALPSPR